MLMLMLLSSGGVLAAEKDTADNSLYATGEGVSTPEPANIKSVTAKNVHTFEIQFEKKENADGYLIFRRDSNSTDTKWGEPIARLSSDSDELTETSEGVYQFTDSTVRAKTDYLYKVETYIGSEENCSNNGEAFLGKAFFLEKVQNVTAKKTGYRQVTVRWKPVEGAAFYKVYQSDGKKMELVSGQASSECVISSVELSESAYTYTVIAYADGDESVYSQSEESNKVYVMLDAPELNKATASAYNKITVSWKSVEHADGYYVYRKTSDSSWKRLTKTPIKALSYTDSAAQPGITYIYTVRAVDNETNSRSEYNHSGISAKTRLSVPKVTKVVPTSGKQISVSWNKVPGAKGYYVYKQYGGKWTKVAAVNGKTSYTYKLPASKEYKYWGRNFAFKVIAYSDYDKTGYSNRVQVTMKPPVTVLSNASSVSYNTNKVTWKKLSGASGYKVYRRIGSGKWTKLATVSSKTTSYSDKKASLGKTYTYTVKAYWKTGSKVQDGYYNANGPKVKTSLGTTSLRSVSPTGLYLKVNWSKVSGAQGYRVYRKANGAKSWTRIATLKGNSSVSYTDKKVKQGTKYTYTVRAYRKSGKTTYWGGYNKTGKTNQVKISIKYKKVTDKNSVMYGKTLKLYYDASGKQIQNLESIVGKKSSYILYVNKSKSMVTAYYQDGKYYVPYRAMICSAGALSSYTPNGTFLTPSKYRWHELMGPSWGQWCTRIHGGVLFHSVFYNSKNNNQALSVSAYNKLGRPASHGCIRLTAGDAKWIYDNCKLKTKVVIYSKSGYEPLKKPTAYKLPSWHKWDPTDPNMKYKCKQKGCH